MHAERSSTCRALFTTLCDDAQVLRTAAVVAAVVAAIGLGVWVARHDDDGSRSAGGAFDPLQDDVLTVATELPAAGFWEGRDVRHVTEGFEFELAQELASQLGLAGVRVVDRPFDDLVDGTARGFDLALAQVSITDARRKDLDLSDSYLTTPVGVVGAAGDDEIPDLAEARTRTWAVAEDTTEVDVVEDLVNPKDEATVYPSTAAALAAVADGEADVAAVDFIRAVAEVEQNPKLALLGQINAPQHYGALLPKDSDNLAAVSSAIRALTADGTLGDLTQALLDRYGDPSVPTIRVTQ